MIRVINCERGGRTCHFVELSKAIFQDLRRPDSFREQVKMPWIKVMIDAIQKTHLLV
jgi:hypothetical protein